MSRIVAISVDKIQSLLFFAINSNQQEKQSNSETLRDIRQASDEISTVFYNVVGLDNEKGIFSGNILEKLLKCSGVCIFSTALSEDDSYQKCKEMFQYYYQKFNGQIQLRYAVYEHDLVTDQNKMTALEYGKRLLKSTEAKNRMIEDNQELLFGLQTYVTKRLGKQTKEPNERPFVNVINELYPEGKSEEDTFRIAIVKVDLDGMGDLFAGTKDYATYQKISSSLNEEVSLDNLQKLSLEQMKYNEDFRVFPLYAAGDDILFAVPVNDLTSAIYMCKSLVRNINKRIGSGAAPISASVGIVLSYNREPIRYYHSRVQEQLDYAKQTEVPEEIKGLSYIKMSIHNCVIFDYDGRELDKEQLKSLNKKRNIVKWWDFCRTINYINGAIANGYKAHYFLYGLLQKMQDLEIRNNDLKLSNMVLYHLIPRHLEGANNQLQVYELQIIKRLLERVTVEENNKFSLVFKENNLKDLSNYVRLLLLFISDERFNIMQVSDEIKDECDKFQGFGELKRQVFFYPLQYLYEVSLSSHWKRSNCLIKGVDEFRNTIVKMSNPQKNDMVFELLSISPSMFYRFKKNKLKIEVTAEYLIQDENRELEAYKINRMEKKQAKKTLPALYFNSDEFIKYGKQCGLWDEADYLDALMIFYEYYHLLKFYRRQYQTNNKGGGGGKRGKNKG